VLKADASLSSKEKTLKFTSIKSLAESNDLFRVNLLETLKISIASGEIPRMTASALFTWSF